MLARPPANPRSNRSAGWHFTSGIAAVTVASGTLSLPASSIARGESAQSSAIAKDINGNPIAGQFFNWSSSDSTIVTVSSSGFAVGVGIGSATITAAAGNGMNGVATENVVGGAPHASIAGMPTQVNVGLGQTTQFAVTLFER